MVREGRQLRWDELAALDPYWQDLVRLLEAYFVRGSDAPGRINAIQEALANQVYLARRTRLARPVRKSLRRAWYRTSA